MRAQADLRELKLNIVTFGTKFDVVLVDPPWEEYARRAPGIDVATWAWQDIMRLEIEAVVDTPSFIFLWCIPPLSTPVTPEPCHDAFSGRALGTACCAVGLYTVQFRPEVHPDSFVVLHICPLHLLVGVHWFTPAASS